MSSINVGSVLRLLTNDSHPENMDDDDDEDGRTAMPTRGVNGGL